MQNGAAGLMVSDVVTFDSVSGLLVMMWKQVARRYFDVLNHRLFQVRPRYLGNRILGYSNKIMTRYTQLFGH